MNFNNRRRSLGVLRLRYSGGYTLLLLLTTTRHTAYRIPVLLDKTFSLPIPLASQQNLQHGSSSMDPPWQLDDLRKCRRLMLGNWFHKMALGLGTALSWFLPLPLPLLLSLPYLPLRMTERDSHNISFTS